MYNFKSFLIDDDSQHICKEQIYGNENVNLLFHINRCGLMKGVRKLGLEEVGMNKRERYTNIIFNTYRL